VILLKILQAFNEYPHQTDVDRFIGYCSYLASLHNTKKAETASLNKIEIKEIRKTNTDNTATVEFKNDALAVALEKDGLIKGDYTLEIENDGMIINGTKVSDEVYAKYKHLIPGVADKK
jgi:archaellum component FlaF (FlaF/FlaG flagellin family)